MGETFYSFLVALFTNSGNLHQNPDQIVSSGLSNLGMFVAYVWLAFSLLWLTTKSVLLRRTRLVYLFASFIGLCGLGHLGHAVMFPMWLQLSLDFTCTVVSLYTAFVMWQQRHFILSAVFQFKYVIGLLRTIERLDETEKL